MKKVTKYIALLLGGIMLVSMAACSDDDGYTPSPAVDPDCIGASFGDENIRSLELEDTDPTEVTLTITRDKTDAAATVGIEVQSNTDGVFSIPSSVSFAAGEATAALVISFENAEFKKEYSFAIALDASAVNPYKGNGYATYTIQRLKWVDVDGTCTFRDWAFGQEDGQNVGYDVKIQRVDGENRYRIVEPFGQVEGEGKDYADEYLFFNIKSNNQVTFTSYTTGCMNDGLLVVGYSAEDYMGVDDVDSNYDPETQTVTFNVYYYGVDLAETGADGLFGQRESVLQLPEGFSLVADEE